LASLVIHSTALRASSRLGVPRSSQRRQAAAALKNDGARDVRDGLMLLLFALVTKADGTFAPLTSLVMTWSGVGAPLAAPINQPFDAGSAIAKGPLGAA
jgi:hypothetical protein